MSNRAFIAVLVIALVAFAGYFVATQVPAVGVWVSSTFTWFIAWAWAGVQVHWIGLTIGGSVVGFLAYAGHAIWNGAKNFFTGKKVAETKILGTYGTGTIQRVNPDVMAIEEKK